LVFFSQTIFETAAMFEYEIEDAGVPLESGSDLLNTFPCVGVKESIEDFLRLVQ
jgi:hypothetical protein